MSRSSHRLGLALGLAVGLAGANVFAFCRTTTCDPNAPDEHCQLDAKQCVTTGLPLSWRSSCVTIGVQAEGSPLNGFTYDDVAGVVELAFGAWMSADCGGGPPSIDVKLIGPVSCGVSEYLSDRGNANIVIFRQDEWPYMGAANAIGLTTTRFDTKTGDLWDADIELNAVGQPLSLGDPITGADLQSVLTHESGHFLGLSHSIDKTATMRAIYDPQRDGTSFRSLAADDVSGICAIYPPARKAPTASCENRHGFSSECGADQPAPATSKGCSVSRSATGGSTGRRAPALAAGLLCALFACRSRARLARRRRPG